MQYTHRTVFRHLIVFGLVAYIITSRQASMETALNWYRFHWLFFSTLFLFSLVFGWFADNLVRARIPADWICRPQPSFLRDLACKWAGCSRCVSYWTAGLVGFGYSFVLGPATTGNNPWIAGLVFGLMSASLAAAAAVAHYLWRAGSSSDLEPDSD